MEPISYNYDPIASWPAHPTRIGLIMNRTGLYHLGVLNDVRAARPGMRIDWIWRWRDCVGNYCSTTGPDCAPPRDAVCRQPGVCVMHDPPGTVVPY